MEYVITTERPFDEIEALARGALERHGLRLEQTFSLRSATGAVRGQAEAAYSIFVLYAPGADGRPLGLLSLYRRGGQTVINPALSVREDGDLDADLVGALLLGDLEVCVGSVGAEGCVDVSRAEEEPKEP